MMKNIPSTLTASVQHADHGYAVLGVADNVPPDTASVLLSIRRHDIKRYLGRNGWHLGQSLFRLPVTRGPRGAEIILPPTIVDQVEEGIPVEIECEELKWKTTIVWPNIPPSTGASDPHPPEIINVDARGQESQEIAQAPAEIAQAPADTSGDVAPSEEAGAETEAPPAASASTTGAGDGSKKEIPKEAAGRDGTSDGSAGAATPGSWRFPLAVAALALLAALAGGVGGYLLGVGRKASLPQAAIPVDRVAAALKTPDRSPLGTAVENDASPEMLYTRGYDYYKGARIEMNVSESVFWLKNATARGHANAAHLLGGLVLRGGTDIDDPDIGVALLAAAAVLGSAAAQAQYGALLVERATTKADCLAGVRMLEHAAAVNVSGASERAASARPTCATLTGG